MFTKVPTKIPTEVPSSIPNLVHSIINCFTSMFWTIKVSRLIECQNVTKWPRLQDHLFMKTPLLTEFTLSSFMRLILFRFQGVIQILSCNKHDVWTNDMTIQLHFWFKSQTIRRRLHWCQIRPNDRLLLVGKQISVKALALYSMSETRRPFLRKLCRWFHQKCCPILP